MRAPEPEEVEMNRGIYISVVKKPWFKFHSEKVKHITNGVISIVE